MILTLPRMDMKKGFTLVEIVVVIGILGILATIGVPKLFVSVAKAKAAEIPVASGSYHTLQDAHLGEKTTLGSWNSIGYIPPGNGSTNNFTYSGDCFDQTPTGQIQKNAIGWKAVSKTSLNGCPINSAWAIALTTASQNTVTYKQLIDQVDCTMLISNWSFGNVDSDCAPLKSESDNEIVDIGTGTTTGSKAEGETATKPQSIDEAKQAIEDAKEAFTMCNNSCANHKQLKAAWDAAKALCEASFGKDACK